MALCLASTTQWPLAQKTVRMKANSQFSRAGGSLSDWRDENKRCYYLKKKKKAWVWHKKGQKIFTTICATLRDAGLNSDSGYVLAGHGLPQEQICKQGDMKPRGMGQLSPECAHLAGRVGWPTWAMHCMGNHWCSAGRRSGGHQSLFTSKPPLDTHSNTAQHLPLNFVTVSCFPARLQERYWCQKKHMKLSRMINIHDK